MTPSDKYCTYLLRLWCTADGQWLASLVDPRTGEQWAFATLERCCEHLRRLARPGHGPAGAANPTATPEIDLE